MEVKHEIMNLQVILERIDTNIQKDKLCCICQNSVSVTKSVVLSEALRDFDILELFQSYLPEIVSTYIRESINRTK